jgi:hypothetical protein
MEADLWPGSHNKLIIQLNPSVIGDAPRTTSLAPPAFLTRVGPRIAAIFAAPAPPAEGSDRSAMVRPGPALDGAKTLKFLVNLRELLLTSWFLIGSVRPD